MLTVVNDELMKIECVFNHVMKLMICWRCNLAIPAEYIAAHIHGKHGIQCTKECVNSIITNYRPKTVEDIMEFNNSITELDLPVDGIPIEQKGFRCLICQHCTGIWDSMTAHFRAKHRGQNVKEMTESNVEMQLLFGGRLRKWFPLKEPGTESIEEQNDDAWTVVQSILASEKRRTMKNSKDKEDNIRLINGFIVRTGWDILTEGENKKKLIGMSAVAKEKDPLRGIMEQCRNYFEGIANNVRTGDVLLRRKIGSTGFTFQLYDGLHLEMIWKINRSKSVSRKVLWRGMYECMRGYSARW